MIIYAGLMFWAAVTFGVMAVLIYKGRTDLIHGYHQTKVKDKVAYGKAFGKALAVIAVAMALSGAVCLFGEGAVWIAVAVLVIGLVTGVMTIVRVQKKYNGGVF